MTQGIDQAIAELKRIPGEAVLAEIDGLIVEIRFKGQSIAMIPPESSLSEGRSYEDAMRSHLGREPVVLKGPGEGYPRREELYDRADLR